MILENNRHYRAPWWANLLMVSPRIEWLIGEAKNLAESAKAKGKVPFVYYGGETGKPTLGVLSEGMASPQKSMWTEALSGAGALVLFAVLSALGSSAFLLLALDRFKH